MKGQEKGARGTYAVQEVFFAKNSYRIVLMSLVNLTVTVNVTRVLSFSFTLLDPPSQTHSESYNENSCK